MPRKTTPTYILLNQITLAAASSSVTFSNIPQIYGDLVLEINGAGASAQGNNYLYFNSDTTTGNYSYVRLVNSGIATASNPAISDFTTTFENLATVHIFDYSSADKHKTRVSTTSNPSSTVIIYASRWANTAPVTSVTFAGQNSGNLVFGTTLRLYGVYA